MSITHHTNEIGLISPISSSRVPLPYSLPILSSPPPYPSSPPCSTSAFPRSRCGVGESLVPPPPLLFLPIPPLSPCSLAPLYHAAGDRGLAAAPDYVATPPLPWGTKAQAAPSYVVLRGAGLRLHGSGCIVRLCPGMPELRPRRGAPPLPFASAPGCRRSSCCFEALASTSAVEGVRDVVDSASPIAAHRARPRCRAGPI
jgi:hypothetical protein